MRCAPERDAQCACVFIRVLGYVCHAKRGPFFFFFSFELFKFIFLVFRFYFLYRALWYFSLLVLRDDILVFVFCLLFFLVDVYSFIRIYSSFFFSLFSLAFPLNLHALHSRSGGSLRCRLQD